MNQPRKMWALAACALLAPAAASAQGPGSCGFHLDIRCNVTGTHSAVADMPNAPGSAGFPYGPVAPGNPYTAYATPGSPLAVVISGNSLAFGPAPLGAGSCLTLFYSVGAPMIPVPAAALPSLPPCAAGDPFVIGVVPILGTIFDACGFLVPPPFTFPVDLGGGRFTFAGVLPPFAPPGLTFQAAGITPAGAIWLTNAVNVFPGPNPAEFPVPAPAPCGAAPALNEGQSPGLPTPAGFTFYGFAALTLDMDTNGFVDFVPGVGPGVAGACDVAGGSSDLGCAPPLPTARPRIDVNHTDYDLGVLPAPPFIPAMTMEFRPPGPNWSDALIYRWKNAAAVGSAPGIAGLATAALVLELHGSMCAACVPPLVGNRIVVVRSWLIAVDQCGIGPGIGGQGYGGPPPAGPTCGLGAAGLAFMTTFAPPLGLPFFGVPGGVVHMDLAASSAAVFNSAIVFTPMSAGVPDAYSLVVH